MKEECCATVEMRDGWVWEMGEMISQSQLGGSTDDGERIEEDAGRVGQVIIVGSANFIVGADVFCSLLVSGIVARSGA